MYTSKGPVSSPDISFNVVLILYVPAKARAQVRVGPKLVVFLHPSAESVRLSSDSLSPEFRSLALLYVH